MLGRLFRAVRLFGLRPFRDIVESSSGMVLRREEIKTCHRVHIEVAGDP